MKTIDIDRLDSKTVIGALAYVVVLVLTYGAVAYAQIVPTAWEFHFRKTPDPATGNVLVELSSTPPPATSHTEVSPFTDACVSAAAGSESWETIRFRALPDGTLEETRVVLTPGAGTPLFAVAVPEAPGAGPWTFVGIAYQLDGESPLRLIGGVPGQAAMGLADLLRQEWGAVDCHTVRAKAMWIKGYDRTNLTPPLWDVVMFQSWVQVTMSVEAVEVTE